MEVDAAEENGGTARGASSTLLVEVPTTRRAFATPEPRQLGLRQAGEDPRARQSAGR